VGGIALDSDSDLGEEQAKTRLARIMENEAKYLFECMGNGGIMMVCLEYYLIVSKSGYSFVEILFCC
jgi:hypothetical protein